MAVSQVCTPDFGSTSLECATPDYTGTSSCPYSYSIDPQFLASFEPVVFNVFYWGINKDDGTSEAPMTEELALASVATLNIFYNQYNIFFKYRGIDYINSNRFYTVSKFPSDDCYVGNLWPFVAENNNQYKKTNAFNVYVAKGSNFGGVAQWYNRVNLIMKTSNIDGSSSDTLIHEVGHCLNLQHTRSSLEHTTRDVNDEYFNAYDKGDRVYDTAANEDLYHDGNYTYIDENCEYIPGFESDNEGFAYEIFPEDVSNSMSNAYKCQDGHFSVGQAIRIRESIDCDKFGEFAAVETTIASLYEPYQGEYYLGGPALPEESKPLFQPGFDYSFIECRCSTNDNSNCSQPTAYEDISFQNLHTIISAYSKYDTHYINMTHPNHTAILIDQLDIGQTRKCYDNYNYSPMGGSITKFNDNVFNTNVTITPQDSISINHPSLINNLQNGLYKIEKNYIDGTTQETVIIKENN